MALPPLSKRNLEILHEEKGHLQKTYGQCAKIFGSNISPNGAKALDRINDAIDAISKEINERAIE